MGSRFVFKGLAFPASDRGWEEVGKTEEGGMDDVMKSIVEKMRADFKRVAEHRKASGDWSESDEAEISAAVGAAVKAEDPDMIKSWALWLADLSCSIAAWELIVRGSLARMRHRAREEREARAQPVQGARR